MHVFLGTCVGLMVLWTMRVDVVDELQFHLLGVTTVALMFGWPMAIVAVSIASLGSLFTGVGSPVFLGLNILLAGAIPIALTSALLTVVQKRLPNNFFIYVYLNAFLAAGLGILCTVSCGALLLLIKDLRSVDWLVYQYFPYLPMLFFSEAVLNGMVVTMLVAFRPQWIKSFDDNLYLNGK